jgi:excisionase family DNA binding protein
VRAEIVLPAEVVEAVATRAAEIVLAELAVATRAAERPYLTVPEAAEILRSSRGRVYDLLSQGRLTRHKDGSRVLVSRAELDAYLGGDVTSRRGPAVAPRRRRQAGGGTTA